MKSFDEWLDTTKLRGYMDENSLEAAWEAGQQSKQSEVDELQKRIDDIELHTKVMIECLLSCSSPSIHMGGQLEAFMSISKILKGDQS